MRITRAAWNEANKLNERGRALADAGDWDAALSCYRRAADQVPVFEPAWFNMGLVHKGRRQWADAMACNLRAASLAGEQGDPAWWNLGIASTALRRWDVARTARQRLGIPIPDGEGEIVMDFGPAPVRLDPHCLSLWDPGTGTRMGLVPGFTPAYYRPAAKELLEVSGSIVRRARHT